MYTLALVYGVERFVATGEDVLPVLRGPVTGLLIYPTVWIVHCGHRVCVLSHLP